MFPLDEEELTFREIADYWSREQIVASDTEDTFSQLLKAFWLGEFESFVCDGLLLLTRADALKGLAHTNDHPGISFEPPEMLQRELADGSVVIEMSYFIGLPEDICLWSSKVTERAFGILTKAVSADYSRRFREGMLVQRLKRGDFLKFCKRAGFPSPTFWTPIDSRPPVMKPDETAVRQMLRHLDPRLAEATSKREIRTEAMQKWPSIRLGTFDRVWKACAPEAYRKSGRKRSKTAAESR